MCNGFHAETKKNNKEKKDRHTKISMHANILTITAGQTANED